MFLKLIVIPISDSEIFMRLRRRRGGKNTNADVLGGSLNFTWAQRPVVLWDVEIYNAGLHSPSHATIVLCRARHVNGTSWTCLLSVERIMVEINRTKCSNVELRWRIFLVYVVYLQILGEHSILFKPQHSYLMELCVWHFLVVLFGLYILTVAVYGEIWIWIIAGVFCL